MRRLLRASLALAVVSLPVALAGCGGGEKVGDIVESPEAKAADEAGQKAMQDFMKSQSKKK
jgi:hypothetical protein